MTKASGFYSAFFILLLVLAFPALATFPFSDKEKRMVHNTAFQRGETLMFSASYNSRVTGSVKAGDAMLQVRSERVMVAGSPGIHLVGELETKGIFNWFFRVENYYDSFLDEESLAPLRFSRRIREGRYRRNDEVTFDPERALAISSRATISSPPYVQDMVSAFYYIRTFDMDQMKPGDAFEVDFYLRDSVYVARFVFEQKERLTIGLGTFNALRFRPEIQDEDAFSQPYPMTLWLSDDKNKIPLLVESGVVVGSARLELTGFRGLKNPLVAFVPNP